MLTAILGALELEPTDNVLEIGPGHGILTRELASRCRSVVAVELDEALVVELGEQFRDSAHVGIVHADALKLDPCLIFPLDPTSHGSRPPPAYKLTGNIPYYITGALLRRYLSHRCRPVRAVLMLQLEVVRRLLARPGEMSLLAVAVQLYSRPSLVSRVAPSAFRPPPRVESAVVRLDVLGAPSVEIPDADRFFRVVRAGFSTRRKQLVNALAHGLQLDKGRVHQQLAAANLPPSCRAQDLSLEQWAGLAWSLS